MVLRDKTIFITGGAGFIGSTLAAKLCVENHVILFDNLQRNSYQYTDLHMHPHIRLVTGDILDFEALADAMEGADIVVHAAAIAGIDTVIQKPVQTMEVNILGTANVLRAAQKLGIPDRVLELSTSEVFGPMAYRASEDQQTVSGSAGEARWSYAVSKLAGEHLSRAYYRQYGLPVVTIRPFNIYGPGQTGEGAIQVFIRQALANDPLYIDGDGQQIRAWCYVDDLVEALLCALENPKAIGESFNIGNARAVTTIYNLATTIIRCLESASTIVFHPPLSSDIQLRIPETKKAETMLGFKAKVELEEGIVRTAQWYCANPLKVLAKQA